MTAENSIPYLTEDTLLGLGISTAEVIKSIEQVIFRQAQQNAWTAPKAVMLPDDGRYLMATLSAADDPNILAVKSLVVNPENLSQGLPQINGLVTLLNSQTGLPIAILDANWITAVRTAGLSATAASYLARRESRIAAFVGCGVQAKSHLQAFADLFPVTEVRLFGRGKNNIDIMREQSERRSLKVIECDSADEAIMSADLIVSSVSYEHDMKPFLDAQKLKPGAFAAIVDLAVPWIKESFAGLNQLIIDDLEQEAVLPNKLAVPKDITGDLSGLVLEECRGRDLEEDRNAFVFRGHALGDLALSILVYEKARLHGLIE
ncbi:MAG: ornithine cyclodeaminase family protein [Pseudomonadota bacterium]